MRRVDKSNVLNTSELRKLGDFTTRERRAAMIGLVTNIRDVTTRKGDAMAIVSLEDRYGTIETVFFPRTWTKYRDTVRGYVGEVVLVRGKADKRRGTVQIICDDISQNFPQFQADREHEAHTNGHPVTVSPPVSRHTAIMMATICHRHGITMGTTAHRTVNALPMEQPAAANCPCANIRTASRRMTVT